MDMKGTVTVAVSSPAMARRDGRPVIRAPVCNSPPELVERITFGISMPDSVSAPSRFGPRMARRARRARGAPERTIRRRHRGDVRAWSLIALLLRAEGRRSAGDRDVRRPRRHRRRWCCAPTAATSRPRYADSQYRGGGSGVGTPAPAVAGDHVRCSAPSAIRSVPRDGTRRAALHARRARRSPVVSRARRGVGAARDTRTARLTDSLDALDRRRLRSYASGRHRSGVCGAHGAA